MIISDKRFLFRTPKLTASIFRGQNAFKNKQILFAGKCWVMIQYLDLKRYNK